MANLLDTNVISQRIKLNPDERIIYWLNRLPETDIFLSVISLQEIRTGIELMPHGRKRQKLEIWLTHDLRQSFRERILPIDDRIAEEAGLILAAGRKAGAEPEIVDALIAATARVHRLRLATLNEKHFKRLGIELVRF